MNKQPTPKPLTLAMTPVGTHAGYMPGFGNDFGTEALPGALPQGMNSPQRCEYGLYGEQLSGTAFTANPPERTWCYRIPRQSSIRTALKRSTYPTGSRRPMLSLT